MTLISLARSVLIAAGLASTTHVFADVFADLKTLTERANQLSDQGKHVEAIDPAEQAVAEAAVRLPPGDPWTAYALELTGYLYYKIYRFDKALPLVKRAVEINEKALGRDAETTGQTIGTLALIYRSMGRYDDALPLAKSALTIYEKAVGPQDAKTATAMAGLALSYIGMGRYDEALPIYTRALAIREEVLGPEHKSTADSLTGISALYRRMGRYEDALSLSKRALTIRENAPVPDDIATANSQNELGSVYIKLERYEDAMPLFKRALAIREKILGTEDPATAESLSTLAVLYREIGHYDDALPLFQRALTIDEKAFGSEHPRVAADLERLSWFYWSLNTSDRALHLAIRALAICEKDYQPNDPRIISPLTALAAVYLDLGRPNEALPLFERALTISETVWGANHRETSLALEWLGGWHKDMGHHDEALSLFLRALTIDEKALGHSDRQTATHMYLLANQYGELKRYDMALPLLQEVVRISVMPDIKGSQSYRSRSAVLARASANLAYALRQRQGEGDLDEAIFYYKLAVNTRQNQRAGMRGLDKAIRESFTQFVSDPYRELADLLIQRGRVAEAERVLLLLKESDLAEYLRRNNGDGSQQKDLVWTAVEEGYRQDLDRVAAQWRDFEQRRLAVMDKVKHGQITENSPAVMELDAQRIQLETRTRNIMSDASSRFVKASQQTNEQRLQAFNNARTELSTKLSELRERGDGGLRTAGLVLLPSERILTLIVTTEQGAVPLVSKISETELNALIKSLRNAILARRDYQAPAEALYRYLIAPAEVQLGDKAAIQHWAILPFGNLRALPFAALRRPDGTHLIEHYAVTMLTADGTGKLEGLETPTRETWRGVALGASQADPEFGNIALPGVRREVCGVIRDQGRGDCSANEGFIGGQRYLDAAFTPELLQHLLSPASGGASFLHIATHFKVEKSLLLVGDGSKLNVAQIFGRKSDDQKQTPQEAPGWTPHLGQYDLIVLSACDSGVSEGAVESLGGMFRSKGAKAVLATLWPVADVGAAPLMIEFYRVRGEKRVMSKAAALQEAQQALLRGSIQDESGKADLRQPYFWAPYILMGNWL